MSRILNINIPLLRVQQEFLTAAEDFVVIVSSRSCGKTWVAVLDAFMEVMKGNNILYMCQNDGSWYKGGWVHLQSFLQKFGLLGEFHWDAKYKTGTIRGKKFYVGTYENVDGARGATECSTLYLDEFMLSKPSIMAALAPCLRGQDALGNPVNPRIRGVSTPNMLSAWQLMIVEAEKYGIRVLRSKMTENIFMTDKQRTVMSNAIFDENLRRQEIEGEILLGDGLSNIISLKDFPREPAYSPSLRVYGGLDMAHTGQRDSHVFSALRGNTLLAFHKFGICDSEAVAQYIRKFNQAYPMESLNMDLAWSESVYDQLKYEIPCSQIAFGGAAPEGQTLAYGNMRAYGYFHLTKLHREGLCVDLQSPWIDPGIVAEYKRDICNIHFTLDRIGRLLIEPKDLIRERIGHSPDAPDALMLAGLDRDNKEVQPAIQAVNGAILSARETDKILSAFEE